jgi:hypothetical protein
MMTRKKTSNRSHHRTPASLLALLFGMLLLAGGASAHAQFGTPGVADTPGAGSGPQRGPVNRGPIQRVADGKVVNKSDVPIVGAVVYLKDSKSVRTFITDDTGHFHFGQLGQNVDYEIWAENNGTRSKSKAISSFDSKNDYNFTLKVDTPKTTAANGPPPA